MGKDDRAQLERSRLFKTFAPDVRSQLLRAGKMMSFPKGAVLWKRGSRGRHVFLLQRGRVGLFDAMTEDRTTVNDVFQPGALIAGRATMSNKPYLFSGQAIDDVRALAIPIPVYRRYFSEPSVLLATTLGLVDGWSRLVLQLRNLKQYSANQRLGFYLLGLTEQRAGRTSVELIDDQLLIAGMLGVTRESLSRSFAQLRAQSVSKRGRTVTIGDVRRLRSYCERGAT